MKMHLIAFMSFLILFTPSGALQAANDADRTVLQQNISQFVEGVRTSDHRASAIRVALDLKLFPGQIPRVRQDEIMALFDLAMQPLRNEGLFDFGKTDIAARLRDGGLRIAANRDVRTIPPMDVLFVQRKVGGIFLLASRLKARVDIRKLLEKYV